MKLEVLVVSVVLLAVWSGCLLFNKRKNRRGVQFTKPFLMPILIILYLLMASAPEHWIILALICGFVGDVFLMWVEKKGFLISGLIAFLFGHVFYIIVFLRSTRFLSVVPLWAYLLIVPYSLYVILVYTKLTDHIQSMKIPILAYMTVIILMSFVSLSRAWAYSGSAFWLPFTGSLFFVVSDTVLAVHTFKQEIKDANVWIMGTYVLAQICIVLGLVG